MSSLSFNQLEIQTRKAEAIAVAHSHPVGDPDNRVVVALLDGDEWLEVTLDAATTRSIITSLQEHVKVVS